MAYRSCPNCQRSIEINPGYVDWCEDCHWSSANPEQVKAENIWGALALRLSHQTGKRAFDFWVKQNLLASPPVSKTYGLALGLSGALVVAYLCLWLAVIMGFFVWWGQGFYVIIPVVLAAIAIYVWPWHFTPVPHEDIIAREQLPLLYQWTDQIADRMGAPKLKGIILTEEYNAGVAQVGWRRVPILYLGLPLWEMLTPSEQLDLLGHEMGHLVNGDTTRKGLTGLALTLLIHTGELICPDDILPEAYQGSFLWASDRMAFETAQLLHIPVKMLQWLIAQGCWGLAHVLLRLLWMDSQRAEYKADLWGLQLAGLEASIGGLKTAAMEDVFWSVVHHRVVNKTAQDPEDLFKAVRQSMDGLPAKELRRREWLLTQEDHRLDATHPATIYRIQMLKSQVAYAKRIPVPMPHPEQLAVELSPWRKEMALKVLDHLRDRLYAR